MLVANRLGGGWVLSKLMKPEGCVFKREGQEGRDGKPFFFSMKPEGCVFKEREGQERESAPVTVRVDLTMYEGA